MNHFPPGHSVLLTETSAGVFRQSARGARRTLLTAVLAISSPADALIELKGGYSLHTTTPTNLNDSFSAYPKITQMQSLSFDVMANVPLMPVGLGVRHEMVKRDESADPYGSAVDWSRTSILVNKRFVDTLMYFGPIASFSVASDFKYKSTVSGVTTTYKTDSALSATVGLEAGAKLLLLRVGAEAGYLYAPLGELKTSTGTPYTNADGTKTTVDMSGTYVRVVVGFGF